MCGFVGLYDKEGKYNISLENSLKKIIHRGPDAQKILKLQKGLALGFVRLAILDLTDAGEQPMSLENQKVTIVFNGEIFNYKELREQLIQKGHMFHSKSDTEVLLHMYQEYGINMLEQLEGMYAIALADQKKEELYLIRDRFGIKPLYYAIQDGVVGFASEIKAMLDMPHVTKNISHEQIGDFLRYEYIHAPNTVFSDIKKIMPGNYIKISAKGLETIEYWDCRRQPQIFISIEEAKKRIIEELKNSLRLHLRSDVPIGVFLSGGIDSGVLAALVSEEVSTVSTYTLRFEDNEFDESNLAKLVSDKYSTNHHCYTVSAQDMKTLLPEMIWYCDELLGDSGILPNYIINKLVAKDGIKVVLSGAGGDELFAGYNYYFGNKKEQFIGTFPGLTNMAAAMIKKVSPLTSKKMKTAALLKKYPEKHMIESEQIFDEMLLDKLGNGFHMAFNIKEFYFNQFQQQGLNGLLYTDIKTYLTDDLMLLADRTTMAHSVEGRIPFLYRPLVELAMSLPESIKAPKKQRKWLLREIAKEYLPEELLNAPKRGFCSPILKWGKGDFGDYIYKILNHEQSISREYWDADAYRGFVSDKNNYVQNFPKMYLLLILELYMRVHVDNNFFSKDEIALEKIYGY